MNLGEAIAANQNAINLATVPQLARVLPVLQRAEQQLAHGMGKFLAAHDGKDTYTRAKHRQMLAQVSEAIDTVKGKLGQAFGHDLKLEGRVAMGVGRDHMAKMIEAGRQQFEGAIAPLRLDVATSSLDNMVFRRFETSARRYAGEAGLEIESRFMLGVIRGESIDQLAGRFLQSSSITRQLRAQGPVPMAHGMASEVFGPLRYRARRLAATELVNAYGVVQTQQIIAADNEDPGYLKKWDAAADNRRCEFCRELDETTAKPTGYFISSRFGRVSHQPLHPFCRCAVVPWRVGWTLN